MDVSDYDLMAENIKMQDASGCTASYPTVCGACVTKLLGFDNLRISYHSPSDLVAVDGLKTGYVPLRAKLTSQTDGQ